MQSARSMVQDSNETEYHVTFNLPSNLYPPFEASEAAAAASEMDDHALV